MVVAQYQNGSEPELTSRQWADVLEPFLNAYYDLASGGLTTFDVTAVSGVCKLPYDVPPEAGEDWDIGGDPGHGLGAFNNWSHQAFRELPKAMEYALARGIDFSQVPYLLVLTERRGRAIATGRSWAVWDGVRHQFVTCAGACIPTLTGDNNEQAFDPDDVFERPNRLDVRRDPPLQLLRELMGNCTHPERLRTVAHEVGHLLGQTDLYNEFQKEGDDDFVELWSLMGSQFMQHLDGYTRKLFDWVPSGRVATLAPPLLADLDQTFTLVPPNLASGRAGHVGELVRLSFGPVNPLNGESIGPFRGLCLEARLPTLADDRNLDRFLAEMSIDGDAVPYRDGLLVTLVTERRPIGPCIVEPCRRGDYLKDATFPAPLGNRPSPTYSRQNDRIRVDVTGRNNDELSVRVRWGKRPMPDVYLDPGAPLGESPDIWIDSPANGLGTFRFGSRPGDNVPDKCGDFPFIGVTIPWYTPVPGGPSFPGPPQLDRVPHRIHIRVRNRGQANANTVRGHCVVIERPSVVDFDWEHPNRLLGLGDDRTFTITNLSHQDGQNNRTVTIEGFEPKGGPFVILVWLEPATADGGDLEPNPFNQLAGEAIVGYQTSMGSPYRPVTVPLSVLNLDPRERELVFAAIPQGLPAGWRAELNRTYADLGSGQEAQFALSLQPPETQKPGLLGTPTLMAYVNYGDGFVPIGVVPVFVETTTRTTCALEVKTDGKAASFTGRVSARRAGLPVSIAVSDSRGGKRYAGTPDGRFGLVQTNRNGEFSATMPYDAKLSYAAIASFGGAPGLEASSSPTVTFGAALPSQPGRLPIGDRPQRPRR
ncbi:MAG: hypothetical protein HXY24_11935 [Rubrivivax sp.]|nr:hypothetical protein [Rubrivivax sp.]